MTVIVNGQAVEAPEGVVVADLVRQLGHDPALPGVAVALDGGIVRRVDWLTTPVPDGAVVEVLTAVQGGA